MPQLFNRFANNLGPRLRLIRTALTRRYVWTDLIDMVKANGFELREIRANVQPFAFAAPMMTGIVPPPDFRRQLGSADGFALSGMPEWNSEPSVSEFLGELAFRLRPRTIVEIGCFVGWTSAHFALGLRAAGTSGRLWCVDSDPRFLAAARDNLSRHGVGSNVEFVNGFSLDPAVLNTLPGEIDLLFIDASHDYDETKRELAVYVPRLSPGGMVALHDSVSWNGVRRAVLDVWDQFETLTFATEFGNGVTVFKRLRADMNRQAHQ
jgi:predicted O-methyltransferase YrrM